MLYKWLWVRRRGLCPIYIYCKINNTICLFVTVQTYISYVSRQDKDDDRGQLQYKERALNTENEYEGAFFIGNENAEEDLHCFKEAGPRRVIIKLPLHDLYMPRIMYEVG